MSRMKKVLDSLTTFTEEIMNKPCWATAVTEVQDGWRALVEVIEEDEYMRRRGRKDLIGVYEIVLDNDLGVRSYQRKELRERGTILRD